MGGGWTRTVVLLAGLVPHVALAQVGSDHANSGPMSSRFRYSPEFMPVAAANQAYRREVAQLLNKRQLNHGDYAQFANMVMYSEMAAQAEIREATDLWRQGRLEEGGWKTYYDWASFDRAKNRPEIGRAWDALRRGLSDGNKDALSAFNQVADRAKQTGLYDNPLWGGNHLSSGRMLAEKHAPLPPVSDRDFVPLTTNRIYKDRSGTPHILSTERPDLGDPVQNLGLADWWGRLSNDQRRGVNQQLKDLSPLKTRDALMTLAGDDISRRVNESVGWPKQNHFEEFARYGVEDTLHDLDPGLQQILRDGLDRMPRATARDLHDKLSELDYRGATPKTMFNAIRRAALKDGSDPFTRQKRNEARVLAGEWNPNLYARINPAQQDYLQGKQSENLARDRQRARDRGQAIGSARASNPALKAWGDDLQKQWEIINRSGLEKAGATAQGFGEAAVGTAEGILTLLTNPGDVIDGIKRVYNNPEIAAVMAINGMEDPDKMFGAIYFEALALPVGELAALKAAGYAGKAGKWLGKFEGVAKLAQRLNKLAQQAKTFAGARKLAKQASEAARLADEAAKAGRPFAAVEYARHAEEAARVLQQFGPMKTALDASESAARAQAALRRSIETAKTTKTASTPATPSRLVPGDHSGLAGLLDGKDAGKASRLEPGSGGGPATPDAPPTSPAGNPRPVADATPPADALPVRNRPRGPPDGALGEPSRVARAAPSLDPKQAAKAMQEAWVKNIDELIDDAELGRTVRQHLRDAGVPEDVMKSLDGLDRDGLSRATRQDPEALIKAARSETPEVKDLVKDLLEKRKNYELQDKDFRYLLNNAERLAALPEATNVTAIPNKTGGLGLTYTGAIDDAGDVFLKADKVMDYGVDETLKVLDGLEPYGGPKNYGKVRVTDPETGLWREAVAMERIDGADLATLSRAMKEGDELPFPVTQKHVDAVADLEQRLASEGKHLSETNLGDFILTPDPDRPLVPVDMFVEGNAIKPRPRAGLLDHANRPIADTVQDLTNAPARRAPPADVGDGLPLEPPVVRGGRKPPPANAAHDTAYTKKKHQIDGAQVTKDLRRGRDAHVFDETADLAALERAVWDRGTYQGNVRGWDRWTHTFEDPVGRRVQNGRADVPLRTVEIKGRATPGGGYEYHLVPRTKPAS